MEQTFTHSIEEGLELLLHLERETMEIAFRSISISGFASLISFFSGIIIAFCITFYNPMLKTIMKTFFNALLSIPAVAIGLFVYLLIGRGGLIESHGVLYTPLAMVIAQAILGLPIATSLSITLFEGVGAEIKEEIVAHGASEFQLFVKLIKEMILPLTSFLIITFSRLIGETGMTLMVGGNIKGFTRVMTTTIALETMRGEFEIAVALTVVLVSIALFLNIVVQVFLKGRI